MKQFENRNKESYQQYADRINRNLTDVIIQDIEYIALMPKTQIKSILNQLGTEALEIIIDDCEKLEKFEVCKIARDLITEKNNK